MIMSFSNFESARGATYREYGISSQILIVTFLEYLLTVVPTASSQMCLKLNVIFRARMAAPVKLD